MQSVRREPKEASLSLACGQGLGSPEEENGSQREQNGAGGGAARSTDLQKVASEKQPLQVPSPLPQLQPQRLNPDSPGPQAHKPPKKKTLHHPSIPNTAVTTMA